MQIDAPVRLRMRVSRNVMRLSSFALAGSTLPLLAEDHSPEAGSRSRFALTRGAYRTRCRRWWRTAARLAFRAGLERRPRSLFGSAGFADREARRPMSRDTIAQIYSMTKPVTGVALMQLWEQGKFGLDDPLSRYLPEFESMRVYAGKDATGSPIYRPAARPISVRDVMRHTAGFAYGPGNTPAHDAYVKADPLALTNDLAEMGKRLAKAPLLFNPGDVGATASQWT